MIVVPKLIEYICRIIIIIRWSSVTIPVTCCSMSHVCRSDAAAAADSVVFSIFL